MTGGPVELASAADDRKQRRWGRPDRAAGHRGRAAAPTWAFRRAVGAAVACLVAGLVLGRADVVLLGVPFALYAALAWGRAARPELGVAFRLDRDRVYEGETVLATATITSDVDLDAAVVSLGVPYALDPADGATRIVTVRGGVPAEITFSLQVHRWGRWKVGPLRITPVGPHLGSAAGAVEVPFVRLVAIGAQEDFRAVEAMPRALATSGGHRSRRLGDGLEFHGLRPFGYGDRLRRINWRVSARLGSLHVTETLTDRMADVVVLLDTAYDAGRSTGFHGQASSLDVTVRAAGAIATHYLHAGDAVSTVEFGGRIRQLTGQHGEAGVSRILDWLLEVEPGTLGWDVQARRIGPQLLPPGALVVVLSPLLEDRCATLLALLRQRGQPIVVVDTLPEEVLPEATRLTEQLARRLWTLERDRTVAGLGELGVPVVRWIGAGSIDAVLRDVVRIARAPRAVLR